MRNRYGKDENHKWWATLYFEKATEAKRKQAHKELDKIFNDAKEIERQKKMIDDIVKGLKPRKKK